MYMINSNFKMIGSFKFLEVMTYQENRQYFSYNQVLMMTSYYTKLSHSFQNASHPPSLLRSSYSSRSQAFATLIRTNGGL